MPFTQIISDPIAQGETAVIKGQIQDENGNGVPASALASLAVSLKNLANGTYINNRQNQPCLNQNGVTVDASGNLVFTMTPADNPIGIPGLGIEPHAIIFNWTYNGGMETGIMQINIFVGATS